MSDNEPWLPPGHAERLTVGTRVRVMSRPECDYCGTTVSIDTGMIGEIRLVDHDSPICDDPAYLSHHYWVSLDGSDIIGHGRLDHFAAAELEPIETIAEHNARVWNERVVRDGQRGSVTDLGMIVVDRQP